MEWMGGSARAHREAKAAPMTCTGTAGLLESSADTCPARSLRALPHAGTRTDGGGGGVPWYIRLADGRRLEGHAENGMLKPGELDDKFLRLTRKTLGARGSAALFERLRQLEDEENLQGLGAQP
jgi:hypothetical protein